MAAQQECVHHCGMTPFQAHPPPQELPVPADDKKLAEVLLALGCTMSESAGEPQVVLRLHGWTSWGAATVAVHMDNLRKLLPAAVKSVGDLHQHMQRNNDIRGRPNWDRVQAACEG